MNNFSYKDINICLISLFIGKRPVWFPYFMQSCKSNSEIEFIFFSDDIKTNSQYENLRFCHFSISDFNILASKKLGFEIKIAGPYKLCDLRPAFGKIFEDYLEGYDFWGYCDNDLIFGDIKFFITDEILGKYDIISSYKSFISGPFCLFRNTKVVIDLFKDVHDYQRIFISDKNFTIDESMLRASCKVLNLMKILYRITFLFRVIAQGKLSFRRINQIKYQFQWYYKRKMLKNNEPVDLTEVVWRVEKSGKIKPFFNEVLLSDVYFTRIKYLNWELKWKDGKLIDTKSNTELFGFHFKESKKRKDFIVSDYKQNSLFYLCKNKIYCDEE